MTRRRRWWRWALIGVGSLLLLIVAMVFAILWIPAASRLVIVEAVKRWDATNPARVEWRTIEGSLGSELRVEGLALLDGEGRPLLRVDQLRLELGLWSLIGGTATVERVALQGVEVWTQHEWGDLGNPDAPPEPPKPGYGPDLPIELRAALVLDDGRVWLSERESIELRHMHVRARGHGREAEAELGAAGITMPSQQLRVDTLALAVRWDSPRAYIERLQLDSPLLAIEQLRGDYDVSVEAGELALDADAQLDALASQFELPLERLLEHGGDRARIKLVARGGPAKLELALELGLGAVGELHVHAAGVPTGPTDRRWAGARVRGRLDAGVLADDAQQGPMRFDLRARVRGREGRSGLVAELSGDLHDRRSGERVQLRADATARSRDRRPDRASVQLDGAGLQLDAQLQRDATALGGSWSVQVDALERPLGWVAALIDQPELARVRGRVASEGRCEASSAESLESLQCKGELRLADASGFGVAVSEARVRARVQPLVDPLALDTKLTARGLRLPGQLALDELTVDARGTLADLHVTAAARGPHERLQLRGAVSIGEPIDVALDRLLLDSDRRETRTRIELLHPTRLRISNTAIEIDALSLAAAGGTIDVDGQLALADGGRSDLQVAIESVALARLDPLIPGPSVAGELSLHASLTGSLAEPSVWARMRADDLRVAMLRPGDIELVAAFGWPPPDDPQLRELLSAELGEHAEHGLRVWARARGPMAARFTLAAALPLRLSGGLGLVAGRELAARVVVERFELLELGGLMPDTPSWWRQRSPDAAAPPGDPKLIPEGLVDLELSLAGTTAQPRVDARVLARRLVIDRTKLGSLLARGSLDDSGVGLELTAKPGFAQLDLRARVPLVLDLRRGQLDWSSEREGHLVSLDVRALELDQLRATLGPKLPMLAELLDRAQLEGLVSLSLRGSGSLANPRLAAALRAGDLRHREQPLGRVRLLASYVPGDAELDLRMHGPLARRLDARLRAPLHLPSTEQPLRLDPERELAAELHADALSLALLAQHVGPLPIAGSLSGSLALTGSLADPQADLRARVEQLATAGDPLGNLLLRVGFEAGRLRLDVDMLREGAQILAAAAELPIILELTAQLSGSTARWDQGGRHQLFVSGRGIDDELLAALLGREHGRVGRITPLAGGRATDLAFDVSGVGNLDAFRIDGALVGDVAIDDQLALALDLGLALDQAAQRLDLTIAPTRGQGLTGSLELAASVPALVSGEQRVDDVPFTARVLAPDFDLRALAGLLPGAVVDPRGSLHAQLRGRGPLGAPRLQGSVELEDAAITVIPMRQRLTDIQLELALDERSAELRRLSLAAGRGGIEGSGRVEIGQAGDLDAALELAIEAFPLIRPGLPAMIVDTGVELDALRRAGETRMAVVLHNSEVTVAGANEATPDAIPSSDDVVVVTRSRGTVDTAAPAEVAEPAEPERFTLQLELREPLLISGTSIDMAWNGALELDVDGGRVEVGGQVEARRGTLRLFGNSFDLRRGVVTLPDDGSLDPYLDVEAVSSLPEAEVTVTVTGRVSRPTLEFASNPALTEYQILTLLITGSTEIGEGDGDVAAQAASLLAAVSNPQLQSQLNQRLGLDRVAIGFGETIDQAILTVGKRFGSDVYVETEYHHNAPEDQNTTQIAIEYGFLPRWSLEGFFGDAAVGALGIYWSRSFPAAEWASHLRLPDLQIER